MFRQERKSQQTEPPDQIIVSCSQDKPGREGRGGGGGGGGVHQEVGLAC